MGYSARYHAASLAAVFLALAIGILIGAGFGGDLIEGTAEDLERGLEADLNDARAEIADLEQQLGEESGFSSALVPAVVADRLRGREIALVALGELDDNLADDVREALEGTGATLSEIAVVREPPDSAAAAAARRESSRNLPRGAALSLAARQAGKALARGGPRFDRLRDALFTRYSGKPGDVDGVVLARSRPDDLSPRAGADTDRVEEGILAGLRAGGSGGEGGIPLVAVERTDTQDSSIEFFSDRDVTTADNIEQLAGRVSLVFALDGAEGDFGVKETADRLLPDLLTPPSLAFGAGEGAGGG